MSGAFFYKFVERDQVKSYMAISYLADKMDPNDFRMANSPYSLLYEKPVPRGPVEVHLHRRDDPRVSYPSDKSNSEGEGACRSSHHAGSKCAWD